MDRQVAVSVTASIAFPGNQVTKGFVYYDIKTPNPPAVEASPVCAREPGEGALVLSVSPSRLSPFMRLPRALQRGSEVEDRSSTITCTVIAWHWDSLCAADSKRGVFLMVALAGSSEIPKPCSILALSAINVGMSETEISPHIHLPLLLYSDRIPPKSWTRDLQE